VIITMNDTHGEFIKDTMGKQYLVVMTGFPGAGKTEVAMYLKKKLGFTRLSSDYLRTAMFGFSDYHIFRQDPQYEEKELLVFDLLQSVKMKCLARGLNVVVDSSAPDNKLRTDLFEVRTNQESRPIEKILIYIRASEDILRERNLKKGRENDPIAEWSAVWDEPRENSIYRVLIYDNDTSVDLDAILIDIARTLIGT
jgi:predicted kinase